MFKIRRRIAAAFNNLTNHHASVLMYHRIAKPATDLWQLSVTPENFEKQLQVLDRTKSVVPLSKVIEQVNNRKIEKNCVAITFDDGYIDNYATAKPLLERYGIPATFFITSKNIDKKKEFWWDELEKIILDTPILPHSLTLNTNNNNFFFDLKNESCLTETTRKAHKGAVAFDPKTLRGQLYLHLWQFISPMPSHQQTDILNQVRNWTGITETSRPEFFSMSSFQVEEIAKNRLFEIGVHTDSHPDLSRRAREAQFVEIKKNQVFLETISGKKIDSIAYPSGKFNDETIEVVKELGFKGAFTTKEEKVHKSSDRYKMGRFQVKNWTAEQLKRLVLS
jgi:peptidoglycan/xylan/chitin deacetylase (PgdA/CDA1 family)